MNEQDIFEIFFNKKTNLLKPESYRFNIRLSTVQAVISLKFRIGY